MSKPIITVDKISKSYRIGLKEERYPTLRDAIVGAVKAPWRRIRNLGEHGNRADTFWALKEVSFDVQRGEVVGIIGRNGAGKSTLLKILSRITEPTAGEARLRGRVASLLEVGTGFHPELTGRENIYLNGAILGMKKAEIDRKFDEIVAFAEVEKFLDTPVKRYSSGMYVRLAFAVAAHLEPEILIVDEVLAVGDAQFQKKCLGKMQDVAKAQGRTVLFVSHNMAAVQALCKRGLLLEAGNLVADTDSYGAVSTYTNRFDECSDVVVANRKDRDGGQLARCLQIWFEDSRGRRISKAVTGESLVVCLEYELFKASCAVDFALAICDAHGRTVYFNGTRFSPIDRELPPRAVVECACARLPLVPAIYRVDTYIRDEMTTLDSVESATKLEVLAGDYYGSGKIPTHYGPGALMDYEWRLRP